MNRKVLYTILALLAISCLTLLYLWLNSTPKILPVHGNLPDYAVKTVPAVCKDSVLPISVNAVLESREVTKVAFAVAGKLEQGELRLEQGSSFRKGQLLYQINNKEAFATLNKVKTELASEIVRILPRIETDFPSEKNKWVRFMEELKPQFLVPALPTFKTSGERYLFMESGCADKYEQLHEMEVNMTNYFYIAPFDGSVIRVFEQPGNQLSKGKPVVQIARTMQFRIKAPIQPEDGSLFRNQTVNVKNMQGDVIGTAVYEGKAVSVNTDGTVNYRFSFKPNRQRPLFHGLQVQLLLSKGRQIRLTEVPVTALRNGNVQILSHKMLVDQPVQQLYTRNGKVGLKGIPCGTTFLTEYVSDVQHQGHYVSAP